MSRLLIETLTGSAICGHVDALAALRIGVFREWPYLYEGSQAYERRYLERYGDCADSVVVLARDGGAVVGASTGLPLLAADADFQAAFTGTDYVPEEVYYFGESVLLPDYRGQGAGRRFFEERQAQARACGAAWAAFCAVERGADDARRPPAYRPLDAFWKRLGYVKQPGMQAHFDWKEVGQAEESRHALTFWLKPL